MPSPATQLWSASDVPLAAEALRRGETVAFPTETVFGLGANACSDAAVRAIFSAKGRPADNPLIVHVPTVEAAKALVDTSDDNVQEHFHALAKRFWPGPLTLVLRQRKDARLSTVATAGLDSVGVRIPSHELALQLLLAAAVPVAAPSANTSGKPSPTRAEHVLRDMAGRIAGVITDGNEIAVGLESTVLDLSRPPPYTILRPGAVTLQQLAACVGSANVRASGGGPQQDVEGAPKAPGMKYVHYAPTAPLHYVNGAVEVLKSVVDKHVADGKRVGVMCPESREFLDSGIRSDRVKVILCGTENDVESIARNLYACLRRFDSDEDAVDVIFCFGFPREGLGCAIQNRLLKASTNVIDSSSVG